MWIESRDSIEVEAAVGLASEVDIDFVVVELASELQDVLAANKGKDIRWNE